MQCPFCHVGQCKKHPLQDHGASARAAFASESVEKLRDRFRQDFIERKRRELEMERLGEASMGRDSKVWFLWAQPRRDWVAKACCPATGIGRAPP